MGIRKNLTRTVSAKNIIFLKHNIFITFYFSFKCVNINKLIFKYYDIILLSKKTQKTKENRGIYSTLCVISHKYI